MGIGSAHWEADFQKWESHGADFQPGDQHTLHFMYLSG